MSAVEYVDRLIERFWLPMNRFLKGDPEPTKRVFSHRDDVTLANPYGPPARGWDEVAKVTKHAASQDGYTEDYIRHHLALGIVATKVSRQSRSPPTPR